MLGKDKPLKVKIEGLKQEWVKSVKLLGLVIDLNLTFDTHIFPKISSRIEVELRILFCHSLIIVL